MWQLLIVGWSLALCAGAAWIRLGYPQAHVPGFARLLDAEPVHVVAHLLLYGSFAAFLTLRSRPWLVLVLTFSVALAQEWVQVIGRRPFGAPEAFDLAVDMVAASLVLLGAAIARHGRGRVTRSSPPG